MSEQLALALIAGGFMIVGSLVTGLFTWLAGKGHRSLRWYRDKLATAYRDIRALKRLEDLYTQILAQHSAAQGIRKNATAWKRDVRKRLRDNGEPSPSDEATVQKAEEGLAKLGSA